MKRDSLKLYVITESSLLKEGESLASVVEEAILGGATMVQYREKKLSYEAMRAEALSIKEICNKHRVPFIINDNVELAKDIDADGVHLGQSDADVSFARQVLSPEKIVGATAKTIEQALLAENKGADYLGSGAVFGTTTKKDAKKMSMELLDNICNAVKIPVVAIGGIDATNAAGLKEAPIAGVAVVSGVFALEDKRRAASRIYDILYGRRVIQCITNPVTMNGVANAILAVGGSPIMAHHELEVEEVQRGAAGLLLNLGATDDYEAMKLAYKTALEVGHPIVIDPVGVGGIKFRRDFLKELLGLGSPTCIRGNFGEIKAILTDENTMAGLDSDETACQEVVSALSEKLNCIIVASGKIDIVADKNQVVLIKAGSSMQKSVTGAGCILSGAIATILSSVYSPTVHSAAYACKYVGDAAENAAERAEGAMSFYTAFMDRLSL